MKSTILSLIIITPISILALELIEFEIDFRSYMFGLGVMWLFNIVEIIISTEISNIKFKAKSNQ